VPTQHPDADELSRRLDRIQTLTSELAEVRGDAIKQQEDLADRIHREFTAANLSCRSRSSQYVYAGQPLV
jgi:hypothetical protein